MDIEGVHDFKVANWVGFPISWEQSANEEEEIDYYKMECCHRHRLAPLFKRVSALSLARMVSPDLTSRLTSM